MRTLTAIERDIHAIPLWLPSWLYKRKLAPLQAEWIAANAELFTRQAELFRRLS